jgi:hypothetical protein
MFLVRSAFWLTLAFVVMRPNFDVQSAVASVQAQALETGKAVIAERILEPSCDTIECVGRNALLATALNSSLSFDPPMQDSSNSPVPFPRPRPDWMG